MVKPKKPEIGVWKTVEAKGRKKHQKEKPKLIHGELPAKTKRQINVNDASRSKNFKQPKFTPKQKFRKQNRQWSNPHISMPFSSYGAPLHVPWEFYFNMHYPYPPWSYNSYMPFSPRYFCSDYITYKESAIKKSPLANNEHFIHKNRSVQEKKHKVTKQVYRVKKDGRLTKNSDLTLEKEKPIIEETSASSIDQIASDFEHASNDIAEQQLSSAVGQEQKRDTRSAETGLTGLETGLTGSSVSVVENPSNKSKARPSFKELLTKYEKEGATQKQRRRSNKVKDVKSTSTSGEQSNHRL